MRTRTRLATVVVAAVLSGVGTAAAPAAHAAPNLCTNYQGYFWSTEQDMADAETLSCRSTWLVDPGIGHLLSRAQVVAQVDGLYSHYGLGRQFAWYAPETTVHIPSGSPFKSSYCTTPWADYDGICQNGQVNTNPAHTMSFDFGYRDVDLHAFSYAGNSLLRVCGNFSVPQDLSGGQAPAPVPVIRGVKFNDADRDGVRDPGEAGIGGWTFRLTRTSSLFGDQALGDVATTTTGADGVYSFRMDGMGPGTYTVTEVPRDRWEPTTGVNRVVVVEAGIGDRTIDVPAFGNAYLNRPPVADAGPSRRVDQTGPDGATLTLDGSGSSDPDGDPLTFTWTGPFGTVSGPQPAATFPVGTSTATLTVDDGLLTDTDTTTVTVYPPITVAGVPVHGVEGGTATGTVATFTDPDPDGKAEEYRAIVDWGDGSTPDTGTISEGGSGFTVQGSHRYAEEGTFPVSVTVTDVHNAYNTDTARSTATVVDAPIHATGIPELLSTNPLTDRVVATFTDENPGAPVADFSATIDWGDGTAPTAGTVAGPVGGPFSVRGSHEYATLGPKTVTVKIKDEGGASDDAVSHVLLYGVSEGGTFAIGDRDARTGTHVEFWGAQWAKDNDLSGGPAPAAFKGFVAGASPACGARWTTEPGNSGHPPVSVPTYLAVVAPSEVTQTGSTIGGNAPHVVIVRTDPGYAGNPGHEGTGTVVATLC